MYNSEASNISLEDKKTICGKVLNFASKALWLEEILIEYKRKEEFINPFVTSVFIPESYIIIVNVDWLNQVGLVEITSTILHETRHAYQRAQVEFREYMRYKEPKERVEIWSKEFDNYKQSTGNEHNDADYIQQELEIDAVAFEKYVMKKIMNVDIIVHPLIKERVNATKITINNTLLN